MPSYYTYNSSNLNDRNKYVSTVNHNNVTKRYFSSIDAAVYFGSTAVEEIVAIDFTLQEPKIPIYGYNSFYPNKLISGRRTITGTFAINFTKTNYLIDILNSIEDSVMYSELEASYTSRCPDNVSLFNKEFDITIGYGYSKWKGETDKEYGTMQSLLGVRIVEYRQALDTEGNPILDMYSFIAKDLKIGDVTVTEEDRIPPAEAVEVEKSSEEIPEEAEQIEITPEFGNTYIDDERNNVNAICANNPDVLGILLSPSIYKDGSLYSSIINIEYINKKAECVIKSIKVNFEDNDLDIRGISHEMTPDKKFTYNGASRQQIRKFFEDGDAKVLKATIDIKMTVNGVDKELTSYQTEFFKK